MRRKRTRIYYEILRAIKRGDHIQGRIRQEANVPHQNFKKYVKELVTAELIRFGERSSHGAEQVYLTPKGAEYVELGHTLELHRKHGRKRLSGAK